MTNCLVIIVKEEGVKAMYQGLSSALVRQAVYGTIKFGLYYSAKETLSPSSSRQSESCLLNLACAVFAGSLSSAIATPTDVIKAGTNASQCHSWCYWRIFYSGQRYFCQRGGQGSMERGFAHSTKSSFSCWSSVACL